MRRLGLMRPTTSAEGPLTRYLWLLWDLWLTFLIYPLNALFNAHPAPLRAAIVISAAAVFAAVYTWNVWRNMRRLNHGLAIGSPWPAIAVLAAIAFALTIGDRRDWIELFIFVGVSMGPSLPTAQAVRAVGAVVLLMVAFGLVYGAGVGFTAQLSLQAAVSGFAVIIVVRTIILNRELRLAREEIARLAVSEERLRFARDLHDLLGHSLSLIALKSELARRLALSAPERAAAEINDIEQVARTALQEVREAVAGYRQAALASELDGARQMLVAAGIEYHLEGEAVALPAAAEAVLSWTVREGVTNVIRHSRARRCTIRLTGDVNNASIAVIDNGTGVPGDGGSGLTGLAERASAIGGRCESGPVAGGGFRLEVTVPVDTVRPERTGAGEGIVASRPA